MFLSENNARRFLKFVLIEFRSMNKKVFWLSIVAVILSFAGGFMLANSLNRKEMSALRAENDNLKKAQTEPAQTDEEGNLSDEEITAKIAEADRSPTNIPFQKNLGLALYNYASMKQNTELLREVERLLTRVYEKNPDDYEAIVALGNINFDVGYFDKKNENFQTAREFYQKALSKKPDDESVRTDLGLTYFLSNPPQTEQAIAEFQKALKINPKDDKTLQVLIQALLSQNKKVEAEKYIAQLKEINPNSEVLSNLNSPPEAGAGDLQKQ